MTRIFVEQFDEDTSLGIAPELTGFVTRNLLREGIVISATPPQPGGPQAHGRMRGRIIGSRTAGSSNTLGQSAGVPAYQVSLSVEVTLRDGTGAELWKTRVHLRDDFLTSGSKPPDGDLATESNRRRALLRLAERAADKIHTQFMLASVQTSGAN